MLVAVRVVALDSSRPMATNMWERGLCWGQEGRSGLRTLHPMSLATQRRRALELVAARASQGWTVSLLSLPALGHHLVGLGVLVNFDRQAESKASSHGDVFDSMWAFQPLRFELVCLDCKASLPFLSLSLSLSLPSPLLSLSLPLSASLHIVMRKDNCGNRENRGNCGNSVGRHGVIMTGSSFSRM